MCFPIFNLPPELFIRVINAIFCVLNPFDIAVFLYIYPSIAEETIIGTDIDDRIKPHPKNTNRLAGFTIPKATFVSIRELGRKKSQFIFQIIYIERNWDIEEPETDIHFSSDSILSHVLSRDVHVILKTWSRYGPLVRKLRLITKQKGTSFLLYPGPESHEHVMFMDCKQVDAHAGIGAAKYTPSVIEATHLANINGGASLFLKTEQPKIRIHMGTLDHMDPRAMTMYSHVKLSAPYATDLYVSFDSKYIPRVNPESEIFKDSITKDATSKFMMENLNWSKKRPEGWFPTADGDTEEDLCTCSDDLFPDSIAFTRQVVRLTYVGIPDKYVAKSDFTYARSFYWKRMVPRYLFPTKTSTKYSVEAVHLQQLKLFDRLQADDGGTPYTFNTPALLDLYLIALPGSDRTWNTQSLFKSTLDLITNLTIARLGTTIYESTRVAISSTHLNPFSQSLRCLRVYGYYPEFLCGPYTRDLTFLSPQLFTGKINFPNLTELTLDLAHFPLLCVGTSPDTIFINLKVTCMNLQILTLLSSDPTVFDGTYDRFIGLWISCGSKLNEIRTQVCIRVRELMVNGRGIKAPGWYRWKYPWFLDHEVNIWRYDESGCWNWKGSTAGCDVTKRFEEVLDEPFAS